jgi:hypothetical protein
LDGFGQIAEISDIFLTSTNVETAFEATRNTLDQAHCDANAFAGEGFSLRLSWAGC